MLQPGKPNKSAKKEQQSVQRNRVKKRDEIVETDALQVTAATREGVVTRYKYLPHV